MTDEELIKQCQVGDEVAFEELYKRFYKSTYYLAMQIANCDADAIDATQETFIEIHKSIQNLREIKAFRLWVKRIVVSKLNKIFAKNKAVLYDDDDIIWKRQAETRNYMIPQEQSHFRSDQEVIHDFVENLSPRYRTIVVLVYFEEMNYKEVAEICQIPEGTVKSRLNMAKKLLKEQIINYEKSEGMAIDFHSINIDGLLLSYFLSKAEGFTLPPMSFAKIGNGIAKVKAKPKMKSTASTTSIATKTVVAVVVVTAAVGGISMASDFIKEQLRGKSVVAENIFRPITTEDGTISTAEQAYRALKLWAHCQYDMEGKSDEDIVKARPIYESLKENGGAYYQLLVEEKWSDRFEEIAY